jgi:hypothetical protein
VAMAGCGSPSVNDFYAAFCDWAVRCTNASSEIQAGCRSNFERQLNGDASGYSVNESIAQGRVVVDEGALGECVGGIRDSDCTQLPNTQRCDQVYTGTVAAGAACRASAECSGGYCAVASGAEIAENGCAGTCRTFAATSASCAMVPCGRADFCNATRVCERRHGSGQPCTGSSACELGLACIGASGATPGTCRGPGAEGEPCTSFIVHTCGPGLYCAAGSPRVCRARVGSGAACTTSAACPDGSACVAATDGSARCGSFLDAGQPCVADPEVGASGCRGGLRCDAASKTCISNLSREGDACTGSCNSSEDLFGDSLYCDATSQTCKRRPKLGEPCTVTMGQSDPCPSPTRCDPGTLVCTLICV